jgi:glycosyltransferase involved in cell wall biosynthesis
VSKLTLITVTHRRADLLNQRALPSVLAQTSRDWEWIVVNEGMDPATARLIEATIPRSPGPIRYLEMPHPEKGFGLAIGRNLALQAAQGQWVAYLDDDNELAPEYAELVLEHLELNPDARMAVVQQHRRRGQGPTSVGPSADTTPASLIQQTERFDSNGFIHWREGAPRWSPRFRIFLDYEYLLRALGAFGEDAFLMVPGTLVDCAQSREGVIGRSRYAEWAAELERIWSERDSYAPLQRLSTQSRIPALIESFRRRAAFGRPIRGFD